MGDRDVTHQGKASRLDWPGEGGVAAVQVEAAATARRRVAVHVAVAQGQFGAERLVAHGLGLGGRGLCNGRAGGDRGKGQQQGELISDPESHGVSFYWTVSCTVVICCSAPLVPVTVMV